MNPDPQAKFMCPIFFCTLFFSTIFKWCHSGEALEVFREEGWIGEVQFFADLENGVVAMAKENFSLGDEGAVDPVLGGGAAGLANDSTEITFR